MQIQNIDKYVIHFMAHINDVDKVNSFITNLIFLSLLANLNIQTKFFLPEPAVFQWTLCKKIQIEKLISRKLVRLWTHSYIFTNVFIYFMKKITIISKNFGWNQQKNCSKVQLYIFILRYNQKSHWIVLKMFNYMFTELIYWKLFLTLGVIKINSHINGQTLKIPRANFLNSTFLFLFFCNQMKIYHLSKYCSIKQAVKTNINFYLIKTYLSTTQHIVYSPSGYFFNTRCHNNQCSFWIQSHF